MEFRPCPSFPGYSCSLCGVVVRDARKSGKPIAVTRGRINMGLRSVFLDFVIHDAWPDLAPPARPIRTKGRYRKGSGRRWVRDADGTIVRSDYPDGRIMTVEEWREKMREMVEAD